MYCRVIVAPFERSAGTSGGALRAGGGAVACVAGVTVGYRI